MAARKGAVAPWGSVRASEARGRTVPWGGSSNAADPEQGPTYYTDRLRFMAEVGKQAQAAANPQQPGTMFLGNTGGSNRGGGRAGGNAAANAGKIKAAAENLFRVDQAPYLLMTSAVMDQRAQANAYNPNFNAIAQNANAMARPYADQAQQGVRQNIGQLGGLGAQLAGQQAGVVNQGTRDIQAGGGNIGAYMDMANQLAADRTSQLGNYGQYATAEGINSANAQRDFGNSLGLITAGGQANLANNRQLLLNQLAEKQANIKLQQAQAAQQAAQAKAQFLISNKAF